MSPPSPVRARPRALLVDLDDTLFDHRAASRAGLDRVRRQFPVLRGLPKARLERRYRELLEDVHPAVVRGDVSAEESRRRRFETLFRDAGASMTAGQVERAIRTYRAGYVDHQTTVRGARGVLGALRPRWKIIVVTNHLRPEQTGKLEALGLAPLVDGLVTAEEMPAPKPDPRAFHRALEVAGTTPERAVVLGDSWATDVVGATSAGIRAVWLNRDRLPAGWPGVDEIPSLVPVARTVAAIEGQPWAPGTPPPG